MISRIQDFKYKRAMALSYFAMFFEGALSVIIIGFMAVLSQKLNRSVGEIAILTSIKSFGTLFVLFFSGRISDKYGRRLPIMIGALLFMVFVIGFVMTKDYTIAMGLAFIGGLAHGFMDTPGMSLLFDALKGNTGPAMSFVQVFYSAGAVMITSVASLFIKNNWEYSHVFLFMAGMNVLLIMLCMLTNFPEISGKSSKKSNIVYEFAPDIQREGLLLLLCTFCSTGFTALMTTWIPTYLEHVKHFELAHSVATLSIYQIGAVSGAFIFALVLRKVHSTILMMTNPAITLLLLCTLFLVNDFFLIQIIVLILGFFMGLYFSLCINMGGELFRANAGAITGAVASSSMLGRTICVWLSGRMIADVGIGVIFLSGIALLIFLTAFAGVFRIYYKKLNPVVR